MTKIDVKKYRYREHIFPPKTIRYCHICKKKTTWIFNPLISHSQCEECGYRLISDKLINYEGRVMDKVNEPRDTKTDKKYRNKGQIQSYLSKLLNKMVKCTLLNSEILEGTLIGINPYEIVILIAEEQVIVFKHAIQSIKENKQS